MAAKKQKKRTSHTPIPGVVQAHAAFLQMQATPDMSPDVLYSTEDGGSCGCAQHKPGGSDCETGDDHVDLDIAATKAALTS